MNIPPASTNLRTRSSVLRGAALLLTAVATVTTVACSSASDATSTGGSEALSAINRSQLNEKLTFLTTVASVATVDASSSTATAALAEMSTDTSADPDIPAFLASAGAELPAHILKLTMPDGSTGLLATREFKTTTSTETITSALTLVEPPSGSGSSFVYAERHTTATGSAIDTGELYLVDGGLQSAGTATFVPETASSSSASDVRSAASPNAAASAQDSSYDAGPTQAENGVSCDVCADVLLAAKILGIASAYATGTGAATAACALVGIPTAEAGGVVCHLLIAALSAGAALPFDFTGRAEICNWASNTVLGLEPICPNVDGATAPTLPAPIPASDAGTTTTSSADAGADAATK